MLLLAGANASTEQIPDEFAITLEALRILSRDGWDGGWRPDAEVLLARTGNKQTVPERIQLPLAQRQVEMPVGAIRVNRSISVPSDWFETYLFGESG